MSFGYTYYLPRLWIRNKNKLKLFWGMGGAEESLKRSKKKKKQALFFADIQQWSRIAGSRLLIPAFEFSLWLRSEKCRTKRKTMFTDAKLRKSSKHEVKVYTCWLLSFTLRLSFFPYKKGPSLYRMCFWIIALTNRWSSVFSWYYSDHISRRT